MSNKKIDIPIFFDVDLTVTEEYQEMPLFRHYFERLKEQSAKANIEINSPGEYWKRPEAIGGPGTSYMQTMVFDLGKSEDFKGVTRDELKEFGKLVKPSPGLVKGLNQLKEDYKNEANLHYFFISVGLQSMINGFIEANGLEKLVEEVGASSFTTDENNVINGIEYAVLPFNKTKEIIQIMKGKKELLNVPLFKDQYQFDYRNMIVIGDGQTDTSKIAYSKKKGGSSLVVYERNNFKKYDQSVAVMGPWADIITPRDYTPDFITFDLMKETIEQKINHKCNFPPSNLYLYKKGNLYDSNLIGVVEKHMKGCDECNSYFNKTFVSPAGMVERHNVILTGYKK